MGLGSVPASDVIPSRGDLKRARGAIATPLLRIGGVPGGCLQRVRDPPLLSLPLLGRNLGLSSLDLWTRQPPDITT